MQWHDYRLTELLNIKYPIIQAGMAGSTTPELVASVSNNGGLGCIGAGYFTPNQLKDEIQHVQSLTQYPFGVNIFVPSQVDYSKTQVDHMNAWLRPYRRALNLEEPTINISEEQQFESMIDMIINYNISVCCFTFGIPNKYTINRLKEANVILVDTATSVDEAIENEHAGMDVVVAQGSEAGGHRGSFLPVKDDRQSEIGLMSLIPQIADNISIPIVAAGGIMDGRGILASMVLGAQGVQMGTAFLTSKESGANELVKQTILKSKETDTIITDVFSGKHARGINNQFVQAMINYDGDISPYPVQNQLTQAIRKQAAANGDSEFTHIWSGQSPRLATNQRVNDLMNQILLQIEHLLTRT